MKPTIPAPEWNALARLARRSRVRAGINARLEEAESGPILHFESGSAFPHPWALSFRWKIDPKLKPLGGVWVATVRPGFVNWNEPTINGVPLTAEEPPEIAFGAFRDPAAGQPAFTESGRLTTTAAEGYPEFFKTLGVVPPQQDDEDAPNAEGLSQLRACDLVLVTPRLATRQTVTMLNPFVDAQSARIDVEFVDDAVRSAESPHHLTTVAKWEPPMPPSAEDKFFGRAIEPQTDELLIATVYFVSPPDVQGDEPDASWQPWPDYAVFWNLAHASKAQWPEVRDDRVRLTVPLAGGIAQANVNELLARANDVNDQVGAFLGAANFRGMHWSPGGFGYDKFPRPSGSIASTPSTGLDPKAARRARVAAEPDPEPLNPPFPFLRTRFDPSFFKLQREALPPF